MAKIDEVFNAVTNLETTTQAVLTKIDELRQAGGATEGQLEDVRGRIQSSVDVLNNAIIDPPQP